MNEDLIEKAAKAIYADYVARYPEEPPMYHAGPGQPVWRHMARAALAVFEEAYSHVLANFESSEPAGDEREALVKILATKRMHTNESLGAQRADAEAILAAGFRRPVSPEPSEGPFSSRHENGRQVQYDDGEWSRVIEFAPEPQTEPQVKLRHADGTPKSNDEIRAEAAAIRAQTEPTYAHREAVAYADDIAEGGDPVPEDYERHYCEADGEDWPCATVRALSERIPDEPFTLEDVAREHERLAEHPNQMSQTVPAFHALTAKALRWAALRAATETTNENGSER